MRRAALVLAGVASLSSCKSETAQDPPPVEAGDVCAPSKDWPASGNDLCNRRFAASETKISKTTAPKLAEKWHYDAAGDVSATPAVVGGSVYVPDWGGNLSRLDAATGKVVWAKAVGGLIDFKNEKGIALGGLVSRTTPALVGSAVIFGTQRNTPAIITDPRPNAFVVAVDKDTGALLWKTPVHEGHPAAVVTGSPAIDGATLYVPVSSLEEAFAGYAPSYACCTFRGSVVAMRATDGQILWQTHTISDERYFKTNTKGQKVPAGYAGASVWSSTPVVDKKRGLLYITTGNNYVVPKGTTTIEPGNAIDAVLALDLATGVVKWARSLIGKTDTWTFQNMEGPDYDFGCGANLFTTSDGKDLVGAGQKSGIYYALDPDTGEVAWQTQVGPGGHLGGIHWGTAVDKQRIYVGVNDEGAKPYVLGGKGKHAGETTTAGSWAALDPKTGAILWQIASPAGPAVNGASVNGPVTVANGVLFAGAMDVKGTMFAIDAETGDALWSFASGGTVYGGAAIVDGVVFWGAGYTGRLGFGTSIKRLYAFEPKL